WSWPTYGAPDVNWSWGFSALLWPVWERAGVWGLFAWRWVTALVAFGFLWGAARRMGARGFAPLVVMVVCSLVWRARSQVRPETLAAVLLAAELWILETRRQGGKDHAWWLVPLAWVWANVHNTWFLGFAVLGFHALDDLLGRRGRAGRVRSRGQTGPSPVPRSAPAAARTAPPARGAQSPARLLWVGLAALAISFANPFGWRALWQPFDFFLHHRDEPIFRSIAELHPVAWGDYWQRGLPLLVAGWPLLALWRARRRGPDWVELACCAAFTALALSALRFVGLYALVAAPYVGRDLDEWLPRPAWLLRAPLASRAALAALACVAAGWAEWSRPEYPLGVGILWNKYPVAACDFMEAHGVRGRGFNEFGFSGYPLYRFWPDRTRLPFIDIHQAGTPADRSLYARAEGSDEAWGALDREHRFDYALLPRGLFGRYGLLDRLDADSTWALVFLDDLMALYVRRSGPLDPVASEVAYRVLPGGAKRFGPLAAACERDSLLRARAAAELTREIAGSPAHAQALLLLSSLAMIEGRHDDARALVARSLAVEPLRGGGHMRLALIALEQGRPREALNEAARERAIVGANAALDVLTGSAWARLGEKSRARAAYRRALAREPGNAEARDSLAALERGAG
ncbi:MAG TPA: hypothetical protein VGK89_05830, partial [Candidatus Eisenbacteria bacterium]